MNRQKKSPVPANKKKAVFKDIAGVILAGGASTRFGSNKALAKYNGMPLIEHAAKVLETLFPTVLLVTNTPAPFQFLHWPTVSDIYPHYGPVAGIHAALKTVSQSKIFVIGCDMPLIQSDLVKYICSLPNDFDAVLPYRDRGPEPLHALYNKSSLPAIEKLLLEGNHKLTDVFKLLKVRKLKTEEIVAVSGNLNSFININTPEKLAALTKEHADQKQQKRPFTASNHGAKRLSFAEAQKCILDLSLPTVKEEISIDQAVGRFAYESIKAANPIPSFSLALMDGFAVSSKDIKGRTNAVTLPIAGEIAAGCTALPKLKKRHALRIMTGAPIPDRADMIIPLEQVDEQNGTISFLPKQARSHIRKKGALYPKGRTIIKAGKRILVDHLPLLAMTGHNRIPVFQQPEITVISTGSELIESSTLPQKGQVVSSNRFLLDALAQEHGGAPTQLSIVPDDLDAILEAFFEIDPSVKIVITTGGTGPGKYDLIRSAFRVAKIKVIYESLAVRPGHNSMLGERDGTLFFALPGPPHTARILFNELVKISILKMQGSKEKASVHAAELTGPVKVGSKGVFHLAGGWAIIDNGKLTVQPVGIGEPINSVIHIPANRCLVKKGEQVSIHLTGHAL